MATSSQNLSASLSSSTSSRRSTNSLHTSSLKHASSNFTFPDQIKPQLQLWVEALFHTLHAFFENRKIPTAAISDSTASISTVEVRKVSGFLSPDAVHSGKSSIPLERRASRLFETTPGLAEDPPLTSLITSPHMADLNQVIVNESHWHAIGDSTSHINIDKKSNSFDSMLAEFEKVVSTVPTVLALESTILNTCIHLVAMMTPCLELELRAQLATSLLQLEECFEPQTPSQTRPEAFPETLLYFSQTDPLMYMHVLFKEIASSFSSFSVAWVHGLICLLDSSEHEVVAVCLKAIQHLVHENEKQFEHLDLQTIVYHLLFRLTGQTEGILGLTSKGSNRDTILQVFLAWCPLIEKRLPDFIEKLVDALFALKIKTVKETALICKIFTTLVPKTTQFHLWILNQIQPEDDDRLDLVHWAADHLCPNATYPLLLDAHVNSPHPYVRYGAGLILSAYFKHHPDQIQPNAPLISLGVYDASSVVCILYRTILSLSHRKLESLVEPSTPVPLAIYEKMAAELRHLTSIRSQFQRFEWMQLWSSTIRTFPPLVFQILLSLLQSQNLRVPALNLINGLSRVLSGMDPGQIKFLWKAVEPSFPEYPELWVHFMNEPGFFKNLFHLLLLGPAPKRLSVYRFLYTKPTSEDSKLELLFWLIGLGDADQTNVQTLIHILEERLPTFRPHLTNMKHQLQDPFKLIMEYDHFTQTMAESEVLSEYTRSNYKFYLDIIWSTYLPAELPFPSPDDYSYQACFKHSPIWLAMLLYRMKAKPPLLSSEEKEGTEETASSHPQNSPSSSHAVKRKLHLGFLTILLPILGYPDPFFRVQACHALFLACFAQTILTNTTARTLMESLSLASCQKVWSYLASTFDLATFFIRAKVPLLSQSLVYQYFHLACEHAMNNPFSPVRISALHFLTACILIFPQAMSTKYSELFITFRPLLIDLDPCVQATTHLTWECFCKELSEMNSLELASVIKESLTDMAAGGPLLASDPFLQPLSRMERHGLVQRYIEALGYIHCHFEHIMPICFGFLSHPSSMYREASARTLMRRLEKLDSMEKKVVLWICLPLSADVNPSVCEAANKDFVETNVLSRILPHTDDATVLTNTAPDTLYNSMLSVPLPNRIEALSSFQKALLKFQFSKGTHFISHAQRMEDLAKLAKAIGPLPQMYISQILYYYEKFVAFPPLKPSGYKSMALFAIEHDVALSTVTRKLVQAAVDASSEAMAALSYLCTQTVMGTHAVFEWLKEIVTKGNDRIVELPFGAVQCFVKIQSFTIDLGIQAQWVDLFYHAIVDTSPLSRGFAFETKLLLTKWLVEWITEERAPALLDQLAWMITRDTQAFYQIQRLYQRFPDLNHSVFALLQNEVSTKALHTSPTVRSYVAQLLSSLSAVSPQMEILLADEDPEVRQFLNQKLTDVYPEHVTNPMQAPKALLSLIVQQEKTASSKVIQHFFAVFRNLADAFPEALELLTPMLLEYLQKADQLRFLLLRSLKVNFPLGKPPTPVLQEQHMLLHGCLMITSELLRFVSDPQVLFQVATQNMHRGLRSQAVYALTQLSLPTDLRQAYLTQLKESLNQPLYEKKVDIFHLLIHFLPKVDLVKHMVPFWTDPNPKIRLAAIQALHEAPSQDLELLLDDIAKFVAKESYAQRLELEALLVKILKKKHPTYEKVSYKQSMAEFSSSI